MESYRTIAVPGEAEYIEKRSRFLAAACPVGAEQEAAAFLAGRQKLFWNASHHCSAFILRSGIQRYSDDREPTGTAGLPMLEVLRKEELCDLIVVVTRYFGGTLLGAGGLARAYAHAARLAVDAAGRVQMNLCRLFGLDMDYFWFGKVSALLEQKGAVLLAQDFGERVSVRARLPAADYEPLCRELLEQTSGALAPQLLGEEFAVLNKPAASSFTP